MIRYRSPLGLTYGEKFKKVVICAPQVRRIRYPSVDEPDTDPWNVAASYEDDWDPDRWSGKTTWGVASRVQSSAPHRPQARHPLNSIIAQLCSAVAYLTSVLYGIGDGET